MTMSMERSAPVTTPLHLQFLQTLNLQSRKRIFCRKVQRVESRPMFEIESTIDLDKPEHLMNGLQPGLVAASLQYPL